MKLSTITGRYEAVLGVAAVGLAVAACLLFPDDHAVNAAA